MRISKNLLLILIAALVAWLILDATIPSHHSLKDFDPHAVARLETDMWRSYYDHHRVALFSELVGLLRSQYHLSTTRSLLGAYYAAHAAVVFQRGKDRPDYEQALPDLVRYYSLIRNGSESPFDVQRAAQLELEWWIIHRQRAQHAPGDLAQSLAALQAEIYSEPAEKFREHAVARADAMLLRDERAQAGGVSDADWKRINDLLDRSYVCLKGAV